MRIGIDVGGTFTDIVLVDDESGQIQYLKVLTTHHNLAEAVITGIDRMLEQVGVSFERIDCLVHGTTIGTNALIERKGARTGLITTEGMRDILEIARVERPDAGLYDMLVDTPLPLVPRYLRCEVPERVGADGSVVVPLDEAAARAAVSVLGEQGVGSIAICFLFGFRNPVHERRVREVCRELLPEVTVSLASEIAPEFREFERTSTTVINAYLQPVLDRYIDNLERQLRERYGQVDLRIMQASGGSMTAADARGRAVNIVNSGPAGGALAASYVGRLTGDDQLIGVDMGGTSFDIGLVVEGKPRVAPASQFEGFPVKMPILDVHAIGAGGGSLAWVDAGGALNVGPESAGSAPGPACYGLGGTRPTVTDANLVLGRLNADYFLGGEIKLHPDLAEKAIREHVAEPLGLSVEEAASGIIRVVNANMVRGISVSSTERGYDVREFALLPFGGAGPLHAVELAADLGMRRVVIPMYPSTLSALGLLVANTRHDYVTTIARSEKELVPEEVLAAFRELEARGRAQLKAQNVPDSMVEIQWSADIRYQGQSYELNTPVVPKESFTQADLDEVIARFHALHQRIYAYGSSEETVEFINLRVGAIGRVPEVAFARMEEAATDASAARKDSRPVYYPGHGFVEAAVYDRARLRPGHVVAGPCLVEEIASTTVIPPDAAGTVDPYGNIIVQLQQETATTYQADTITMQVIRYAMEQVADEMGRTLVRTGRSTVIKEIEDITCAVFDRHGNTIGQAHHAPMLLTGFELGMHALLKKYRPADLDPGDIIIFNDPYAGGQHVMDLVTFAPVHYQGELVGFVGSIAHHADMGGAAPGGTTGGLNEIYLEGLRFPMVKLYKKGQEDPELFGILANNIRVPHKTLGDIRAQTSADFVGVQRMQAIFAKYGVAVVQRCQAMLLDYSENRIRAGLRRIPDGTYSGVDYVDDDGRSDTPIKLQVNIHKHGEEALIDFDGTARQVQGNINCPLATVHAAVYYALIAVIDPHVPPNSGCYRPFRIEAEEGLIVNPRMPGAVGARTNTSQKITEAMMLALSQAVPNGVMAGSHGQITNCGFSGYDPQTGRRFVYIDIQGGGAGARPTKDGRDGQDSHLARFKNTPIEAVELEYPVRVLRYELIPDSGGAGKYRGGLAVRRDIEMLIDDITLGRYGDRQRFSPFGLFGGKEGSKGRFVLNPGTPREQRLKSKGLDVLHAGDVVSLRLPGAGGYGDPLERDREQLLADVRDGKVSLESARENYRVVIDPDTLTVDEEATAKLQQNAR